MRASGLLILALLLPHAACLDRDLQRGDDALGQGRYDDAIAAYEAARKRLPPKDPTPSERLAAAHRAKGMAALEQDDCPLAESEFGLAAAFSEPVLADYQQLFACRERNNADPAVQVADLRRLLELKDPRHHTRLALMRLELSIGEREAAVAHLPHIQGIMTARDQSLILKTLLDMGRNEAAFPLLVQHAYKHPDDPLIQLKLAELSEERGDLKRARNVYSDLVRNLPNNPIVHLRQAAFLKRQGDLHGAARAQGRADEIRGVVREERELRPLLKSRK